MGGGLPDLSPDCFDLEKVKKQYEELKKKAKENLSIDPQKIADAVEGFKEIAGKFDKFTSCKEIIQNIADNDLREKVIGVVTEIRKKQLGGGGDDKKQEELKKEEPKRTKLLKKGPTRGSGGGMLDQMQGALDSHSEASSILKQNIGGESSGGKESDPIDDQIKIETGQMTEEKFVNEKYKEWTQKNNAKGTPVMPVQVDDGKKRPNLEYGDATNRPKTEERDEQYAVLVTPNKSGIYVNERTDQDPGSIYLVFEGKNNALRINAEGFHLSSDQHFRERTTGNHDIAVDGQVHIAVKGGRYDIFVNGKINIFSTQDINITSEQNINLTAKQNINMQSNQSITAQAKSDITLRADGEIKSHSEGKFSIDTAADFHTKAGGGIATQSGGKLSLKSGGEVGIDGSATYLQSGSAGDASPSIADKVNVDSADPVAPTVPQI